MTRRSTAGLAALAATLALACAHAVAQQAYPEKPIKVIAQP